MLRDVPPSIASGTRVASVGSAAAGALSDCVDGRSAMGFKTFPAALIRAIGMREREKLKREATVLLLQGGREPASRRGRRRNYQRLSDRAR